MTVSFTADQLVFSLRAARQPAFVPQRDDLVAFLQMTPDREADRTRAALKIVSLESGEASTVGSEFEDVHQYAFSRTGGSLAMVAGDNRELLLAGFDPQGATAAVPESLSVQSVDSVPVWSPSGLSLAVTLKPELPSGSAPQIATGRFYKEDGSGFIGQGRRQVAVVATEKRSSRVVTSEEQGASHPAWSPNGSLIAVRVGHPDGWPWASVAVFDRDTGACRRLRNYRGTVETILFESDSEVLFVGSRRRPMTFFTDLLRWNLETDTLEEVASDLPWQIWVFGFHVSPALPTWRDVTTLWLSGIHRGLSGLYSVDVRDGSWEQFASSRDVRGGMAVNSTGDVIVQELSSLGSTGELIELDLKTHTERLVTHLNDDFFRGPSVGVKRIEVQRDVGLMDVWILSSPHGEESKDGPIVLDIHGGPHNFYGEFFLPEHQLLAANGFTVVYCNPRGTGSYGSEYAEATAGCWGSTDTDDIIAALEAALDVLGRGRDVVISGWSYGGFQVLTLVSRFPERFAAAICGAPAADFRSWYGTSDAAAMAIEELGGRPHERGGYCVERSPATHLDASNTPLLLLHGLEDMRSPVGQTELAHRIATDAGCTVRYVRYPGASHGFRHTGIPSHRAHVLGEIVAWAQAWTG